jgi:adenylate cyclase
VGNQVEPGPQPLLILDWQDRRITIDAHRGAVVCGSRPDADLNVLRPYVSRRHGRIERRRDSFVLVDESTNGTFVQTEDQRVLFVRRGELRLWGEGWISFGEPPTDGSAVRFRHD